MWTAWTRQSIQAGTESSSGEPVAGASPYATPANLSAPLTANPRHSAPWSAPRTFTQNAPARAMRGQVVDVRATMKVTSGGFSESEAKDWQAKPVGPSVSRAVTTVTPLAKWPSTRRNSAGAIGSRSSSRTALRSGRGQRPVRCLRCGCRGGADGPEVPDGGGGHACVSHHALHKN